MFALLISLSSLAQREGGGGDDPGEPIFCENPLQLTVSHSIYNGTNSLPCTGTLEEGGGPASYTSQPFYFVLTRTPENANHGYTVTSNLNITWQIVPPEPGANSNLNDVIFKIVFKSPGWHSLSFNGNPGCELPYQVDVPVLCDCPQFTYKTLGHPNFDVTIDESALTGVNNFYVVGNISLAQATNMTVGAKTFTALSKNRYNTNAPGGEIFSPSITLGDKTTATSVMLSINGCTFKGDPCFGMWKGLRLYDSTYGPMVYFQSNTVKDAEIGLYTPNLTMAKRLTMVGNTFTSNLIASKITSASVRGIKDNTFESGTMLKPYDYEEVVGNHNYDLNGEYGQINKYYTRYGIWFYNSSGSSGGYSQVYDNRFKNLITGVLYPESGVSDDTLEFNLFENNRFSGTTKPESGGFLIRGSIFYVTNPDVNNNTPFVQLKQERVLWNRPASYGVLTFDQSDIQVYLHNSQFFATTENTVATELGWYLVEMQNNDFNGRFDVAIRGRNYVAVNKIEKNNFTNCKRGIEIKQGGPSAFSPQCNIFTFQQQTDVAFYLGAGVTLANNRICEPSLPGGNRFNNRGIVVHNDASNASVTYNSYQNEIVNLTDHIFTNSILDRQGISGNNQTCAPRFPNIFVPRIGSFNSSKPEFGEDFPTTTPIKVFDISGKLINDVKSINALDEATLPKGIYLLISNNKKFLYKK